MTGRKTTGDDWRKTTERTGEKFSYNLVVEIIAESLQSYVGLGAKILPLKLPYFPYSNPSRNQHCACA